MAVRFPVVRPELPAQESWSCYLNEAYRANWFTNFGVLSRRLESELCARWSHDTACGVAVSNGTSAIAAPLIAAGVTGNVLVPAFTFPATAWAVRMAGAEPVLIDVDFHTWRVSAEQFDAALAKSGARGAVLVCPFGLSSDFSEHEAIAQRRGACLVIDNAAGLGARRREKPYPEHVYETFSLHATKPFGIGEGGLIFAHSSREEPLRRALNFGFPALGADGSADWGINGKLSEMLAAVGLAVAASYPTRLMKRQAMAWRYMEAFGDIAGLHFPNDPGMAPWQLFPVLMARSGDVEVFMRRAAERGIETRRYYRPALSTIGSLPQLQPCTVSEDLADRMICLPVYSTDAGERDLLVEELRQLLANTT